MESSLPFTFLSLPLVFISIFIITTFTPAASASSDGVHQSTAVSSAAAAASSSAVWSPCENVCGNVPVMYPFGASRGCGSQAFEKYVNCSKEKGTLVLHTPTGEYAVHKIDYANNVMVVLDPAMSTCAKLVHPQRAVSGFGLPVGAPFEVVSGNRFLLLGCAESALVTAAATLCDAAATPICAALYGGCPAVEGGGGSAATCCAYSAAASLQQQQQQPFQIDLPLLQCSAYTSIYAFGSGGSSGAVQDPSTWSYGIALKFFYDQSVFDSTCRSCQRSRGSCAYNVYGFVCVCSAGVNTTTDCFGTAHFSSAPQKQAISILRTILLQGLVGLLASLNMGFWLYH